MNDIDADTDTFKGGYMRQFQPRSIYKIWKQ